MLGWAVCYVRSISAGVTCERGPRKFEPCGEVTTPAARPEIPALRDGEIRSVSLTRDFALAVAKGMPGWTFVNQ